MNEPETPREEERREFDEVTSAQRREIERLKVELAELGEAHQGLIRDLGDAIQLPNKSQNEMLAEVIRVRVDRKSQMDYILEHLRPAAQLPEIPPSANMREEAEHYHVSLNREWCLDIYKSGSVVAATRRGEVDHIYGLGEIKMSALESDVIVQAALEHYAAHRAYNIHPSSENSRQINLTRDALFQSCDTREPAVFANWIRAPKEEPSC